MNWKLIIAIVVIVLAIIIIWGLIGGNVVDECDVGLGDSLCWKWHDVVAEFQDNVQEATDSFKNMFEK